MTVRSRRCAVSVGPMLVQIASVKFDFSKRNETRKENIRAEDISAEGRREAGVGGARGGGSGGFPSWSTSRLGLGGELGVFDTKTRQIRAQEDAPVLFFCRCSGLERLGRNNINITTLTVWLSRTELLGELGEGSVG